MDKLERELKLAIGSLSKLQALATQVEELEKNEGRIKTLEQQLTEAKEKIKALEMQISSFEVMDDGGESRGRVRQARVKKGKSTLPGEDSQFQKALAGGQFDIPTIEGIQTRLITDMSRTAARPLPSV